ncbi:MAG: PAS domain S-box protein [Methanomicrobiales archaeon]|nr:PAS domain S-box protein [Methanomicrobiales archaeon]
MDQKDSKGKGHAGPAKTEPTHRSESHHPPIAVLYVDDEPALLDPIRHYLEKRGGFSVDTITSVKGARQKMATKKYDVIVSDYQMPETDGITFLKQLREENNPIPFLIFTGKGHEDVVVEAYNAGADFYIPKGGNPKAMFLDLTQKINQIVTRRRSEEALFESEERYRKVVEQSHDGIFIFQGADLVFFNDRVTEMSGYSREELGSMDIWSIIHTEDLADLRKAERDQKHGRPAPKTYEVRIITKTGETRYLEIAIASLTFRGTDSILGSARDITERKYAEEALRKSEEKYRSIFDTFDDLYYQTDMSGIITSLSPSCKRITGWEPSELIGLQVLDLYPFPDQRKLLLATMFLNGAVHDYEVVLKNKKGEHLNVSVTSHVVRDESGNPVAIEGALRDITKRIRMENALHASEMRYRSLADFLPVMVFETDIRGMLTFGNRLIMPVFGIDPSAIGSDINVIDYIAPEDRERALENIRKVFAGEPRISNEYTLVKKDGTRFSTMINASAIVDEKSGEPVGMRGVIIDLTERKQAEQALRDSEELFRTLFNSANDAIFLHLIQPDGKPGQYIMVNDVACSRLGYTREELLTMSPFDVVSLSHIPNIGGITREMQKNGKATFDAIHRRKDGTEFSVEINAHLFDLKGTKMSLSIARDITERKQMEDAIRASEHRLHAIIDGAAIPLFVINRNHEIIYWNRALARYTGVPEEKIKGTRDAWKPFYDDPRPLLADLVLENNISGIAMWYKGQYLQSSVTPGAYEVTGYFDKIGKNGTWMHMTAIVIRDDRGEIIGALQTLEDITDRRNAEKELIASETYLKTIFNSVQTALVIIDPETHRIFDLNPAAVALIGADRDALINTPCQQGICPIKAGRCPITDMHLQFVNTEQLVITTNGKKIPVTKTIVPVTIAGKKYLLENILDNTDRKLAEDAMQRAYFELEQKVDERTKELSRLTENLKNEIAERNRVMIALTVSEEKYRSLVEQTNDLVFHINDKGEITYISPNIHTILGIPDSVILGKNPTDFMTEASRPAFVRMHEQNVSRQEPVSGIELAFFDKDKNTRIFEINGTPHIDPAGKFIGFSGIARDITYKKALQDEIAASLKEKEILLKEIHHRVKNNMQVISSLLNLQAKMVKDARSREAIQESQNRVMSIALVHEKLYQSRSLAQIDYSEYIKKMTENLLDSYNVHPGKVQLRVEAESVILPITKAIPVSLIINELLTNSLKYAFPDDRTGIIGVRFGKEGDQYILTVWDNGIGLPAGFVWDKTDTLGLQLVSSLVGQLSGTIRFSGEGGTEFRITFTVDAQAGEHNG